MLHHTLICQLDDSKIKFRTTRVSSAPTKSQIHDICLHNINTIQKILDYCKDNDITSYRIPSNIFPLWTHPLYEKTCDEIFQELLPNMKGLKTHDIHLSCHPDQFILLNSLNQDVNDRSIKELNKWGEISKIIPIKLLNIHVGGRQSSLEEHCNILVQNFNKLSKETQSILSLENDEKSYSFHDTLYIAGFVGAMVVPDFHHERCFQLRQGNTHEQATHNIMMYIGSILHSYKGKKATPTFHISSPKHGWTDNFKDNCKHADYIDVDRDYPLVLHKFAEKIDICLDVEAKAKNNAIHALYTQLF